MPDYRFRDTMTSIPGNLDGRIRHLGNPPIVEAVIHWQARAEDAFDLEKWRESLGIQMTGYGAPEPIQQFEAMVFFQDDTSSSSHKQRVDGIRFTSDDKRHITQFKRDGVVFSRLKPYVDWEQFTGEALRVWKVFVDFAAPAEIQRLGVRFINHLPAVEAHSLGRILIDPPTCPANLPLNEFVYQSTFRVPGRPFGVRVIKLLQPGTQYPAEASGLFLDCDVYSTKPVECEPEAVTDALAEMRQLKNRIFFSLLTDEAIREFE